MIATSAFVAQAGGSGGIGPYLLWVGVFLVLVIGAGLAILAYRRMMLSSHAADSHSGILGSLRKMRDSGRMTQAEYDAARKSIAAKVAVRPPMPGNSTSAGTRSSRKATPSADVVSRAHEEPASVRRARQILNSPLPRAHGSPILDGGVFGGLIGFLLGYPVSYFFQSGVLRAFASMGDYVSGFSTVMRDRSLFPTALGVWIVCVLALALGGAFVGVLRTRSARPDTGTMPLPPSVDSLTARPGFDLTGAPLPKPPANPPNSA